MSAPDLHVVAMCTHNRSRSVLMGALLERHLAAAGVAAHISTAGTAPSDLPPTPTAVDLLAAHGIDVSGHRSRQIDTDLVLGADLVVTAEVQHVVFVSGRWADTFGRVFTLPELVQRGEAVGRRRHDEPLQRWLARVGEGRRTGFDYLSDDSTPEIADPTGFGPMVWKAVLAELDTLTARLAALLA